MDSSVNYDASPPRDAGCWSDDPEGTSDHPMPGNQVRRGSEQPDRGCWMPWDFGTEKAGAALSLMTSVHRGHAHYSGIPGSPPILHTISKCFLFTG